jgi:hypothetical protein
MCLQDYIIKQRIYFDEWFESPHYRAFLAIRASFPKGNIGSNRIGSASFYALHFLFSTLRSLLWFLSSFFMELFVLCTAEQIPLMELFFLITAVFVFFSIHGTNITKL